MNIRILLSIFFISPFFFQTVIAQDAATSDNSLKGAFEQLKEDSYDFENNEVIKKPLLEQFWRQVNDTLAARKQEYQEAQGKISELNNTIAGMEAAMAQKDKAMEENQFLVEHIHVLGIPLPKNVYVYANFIIILALGGVIGYGYGKYKQNEKIAQTKTTEYQKAVDDLENYKKKAKDKEMKLRRELQTEINKNEELKKRISG